MTAPAPGVSATRETELLATVPTGLLIDGRWRDASGGGTFDVHDPATEAVLATLASATIEDAVAALDAASAAQSDWARTAPPRTGCDPAPGLRPGSPSGPRTSPCS